MSVYIPKEESGTVAAANSAASIGSQIVKPLTIGLMIVALPVAVTLIKVLQALDFLTFINIKNMPKNVKFILKMVGQGSFVGGMMDPMLGDFWLFDDPALNKDQGGEDEE